MHHPTDRIVHTKAFVIPVVEHWLKQEIAQWVHHEGLIRRPIASWANALTTELHLAPLHRLKSRGHLSPVGSPGGQNPPCPKFILRVILTKLGHKYTHRRTIPITDKHQVLGSTLNFICITYHCSLFLKRVVIKILKTFMFLTKSLSHSKLKAITSENYFCQDKGYGKKWKWV